MSKFLKVSIPLLIGTVLYQRIVIQKLNNAVNNLSEATTFLIDILEQHEVELNDFDVIALSDIFEMTS